MVQELEQHRLTEAQVYFILMYLSWLDSSPSPSFLPSLLPSLLPALHPRSPWERASLSSLSPRLGASCYLAVEHYLEFTRILKGTRWGRFLSTPGVFAAVPEGVGRS